MTTEKPSSPEDEYFARENAERIRKLHKEEQSRLQQSEKDALRKLHAGRCSNCGALMVPERVAPPTSCIVPPAAEPSSTASPGSSSTPMPSRTA